ncbi:hypothetical protein HY989_02935 [Candidatus Micrarchaeota archaeon]|nr:hypothetical protein [Candidatus Micrarchaeota archaeon]
MDAGKYAIALGLLMALGSQANALSEFNYLFPEFSPPSTLIFIFAPRNCMDAAPPFTPMERNFILDGNAQVFANFDAAIGSQASIRKISRYIPKAAYGLPVLGGAFSYVCFDLAVKSVNFANAAIKSAFLKIDADKDKLESMQGSNEIFSRGITDEILEIEQKMLSANKPPNLSMKIREASKTIAQLQLEYPNTNRWGILDKLIGADGILQDTQALHQRIASSIKALGRVHLEESEKNPELLFDAQFQLDKIKEAKIPQIKKLELNELGIWDRAASRFALPAYGKYHEIENEIGLARLLQTHSSKVLAKKDRGYLATSYLKLQDANKKLEFVSGTSKSILDETERLEGFLQKAQESLQMDVEKSVEKKSGEPFAHDYLKAKLDEYKKRRGNFPYEAKIGIRINEFAFEISILEGILREAVASDFLLMKRYELLSQIEEFSTALKHAKADGIEIAEEESKLFLIKSSLQSFGLDADLPVLEEIENNLLKIKKSLGVSLEGRYPSLNGQYSELVKDKGFLQLADRITLESYEKYFDGGSIDLAKAAGSLAGMEKFMARKIEETADKKNSIAKETLQNSIVIWEICEKSKLDMPTKVTAYVDIENPLEFDVEEAKLSLDLPLGAVLVNSTGNMRLEKEKGKLFVNIKRPLDHNLAVFEYQIIANRLVDASVRAAAGLNEIKVEKSIRFQTSKSSELDLEFDAISDDFLIEYRGEALGKIENGKLKVSLAAAPGENEITAVFIAKAPFAQKISIAPMPNSQVLVEAKYLNKFSDLPKAQIPLHLQTDCDISKVIVDRSDFEFSDKSKGNFLELDLQADYWARGTEKEITARLICNNEIASIVNSQIDKANPENSVSESLKIENARQLFAQGRYLEALGLVQSTSMDDGKRAELENRASIIEKTAKLLLENADTKDFGTALLGKVEELQKNIADGNYADAKNLAGNIEDEIGNAIDGKIALARQECRNLCKPDAVELLDSAIVSQISGDYFKAFGDLFGIREKLEAQKIEMENAIVEKTTAIGNLAKLSSGSSDAAYEFELFFEIPSELKADRQRDENYKEGVLAQAGLKKLLLELEGINNAIKTGQDSKYSQDLIDSKMNRAEEMLSDLQNANSKIAENAAAEIDEMEKRSVQFGKEGDLEKVSFVRAEYDKRHYFSAYANAKNLNYVLTPNAVQSSPDLMPYALPSVAILVGIAYFALFRKKE